MSAYHVPCCPTCLLPLVQAEGDDTRGVCPSLWCPHDGQTFGPDDWAWLHQEVFDWTQLPPYDGWLPIRVDA